VLARRVWLAGFLLGFGVHFKIYPFIYAPAFVLYLSANDRATAEKKGDKKDKVYVDALIRWKNDPIGAFTSFATGLVTPSTIILSGVSLLTFSLLNMAMYAMYGYLFLQHTYLHHLTRIDHRHNFSPYNTLLYLSSAASSTSSPPNLSSVTSASTFNPESLSFLPQLLLAVVLIPLVLARSHLPTCLLAQTFAFVALNKVCTSQYFLWYLCLLPLHLPRSSLLRNPRKGIVALALWILGQAAWLQQGFELEARGRSTFVYWLWWAGLGFLVVNMWILGVVVGDGD